MPDGRHQRKKLIESLVSVEPGTLGFHVRQYLRNLEIRNYSKETIRSRESHLRYFILWCDERGIARPEEVSVALLERFQRHLYAYRTMGGRPLTFGSQGVRLVEIRSFYRWLVRNRIIEMSPAESLEMPRKNYRLPKAILSVEEVETILAACDLKSPMGMRDRAVLEVLYATGIRRFELCNLKVWDIDLDNGTMIVRQGKGKKDRCIPIGERAGLWLQKYIDDVRPLFAMEPDSGFLFLTRYRDPFSPERVSEIIREVVGASGINKPVSAHIFRHTMATLMLEGGADIRYVQAMLGHAQLTTTEIYTRVAIRKLKEVHAMAHPGAKLERAKTAGEIERETELQIEREALLSSLAAEAAEEENSSDQ
jgi:integrase/recombinase XerD